MKKYDNYKDSNQDFLGKIPSHWFSTTLKRIAEVKDGTHDTPSYVEEEGIPFITTKDLSNGNISFENCKYISYDDYLSINKRSNVENGDIIMPMIGSIGSPIIVKTEKPFSIKNLALIKKNRECDLRYICYYLNSEATLYQFGLCTSGGVQNFISLGVLRNLGIPKIDKEEQTAIANYLDRKTTQIDTLITKKEQFISLLQEERTAVINQAVTKGLDPKVKMKDSGIEWLGEIPEHWEVKKLKFVSKITRGAILRPVDEPSYFDDNGEWTYLNISDATICDKYLDYGKLRLSELGSTKSARVEPNNLIITASATIGKPFVNKIPVCVHDGFIPITELKVNIDFLYNYFKNPQLFNGLGKSNTQKNIYLEDVKNLIIPIPNLEEQLLIARYIEEEIIRIETLISKSLQEIELLKEYKTALISEVVTGKVDVRDVILN